MLIHVVFSRIQFIVGCETKDLNSLLWGPQHDSHLPSEAREEERKVSDSEAKFFL